MNILLLDTSSKYTCITLIQNYDSASVMFPISNSQGHENKILYLVEVMLKLKALQLSHIQYIAYGGGSGSLMGQRIAKVVSHAIAVSLNIPILCFSTLLAYACAYYAVFNNRKDNLIVLRPYYGKMINYGLYTFEPHNSYPTTITEMCVPLTSINLHPNDKVFAEDSLFSTIKANAFFTYPRLHYIRQYLKYRIARSEFLSLD